VKEYSINPGTVAHQQGYGFITFAEEASAHMALHHAEGLVCDGIRFACTQSHRYGLSNVNNESIHAPDLKQPAPLQPSPTIGSSLPTSLFGNHETSIPVLTTPLQLNAPLSTPFSRNILGESITHTPQDTLFETLSLNGDRRHPRQLESSLFHPPPHFQTSPTSTFHRTSMIPNPRTSEEQSGVYMSQPNYRSQFYEEPTDQRMAPSFAAFAQSMPSHQLDTSLMGAVSNETFSPSVFHAANSVNEQIPIPPQLPSNRRQRIQMMMLAQQQQQQQEQQRRLQYQQQQQQQAHAGMIAAAEMRDHQQQQRLGPWSLNQMPSSSTGSFIQQSASVNNLPTGPSFQQNTFHRNDGNNNTNGHNHHMRDFSR
jgi:hypothetical protein